MKERVKIKKWQLVAYRSQKPSVDLSAESFVSVGKQSFKRQKRMEELVLPCGVSAIKTEAFARCRRLKSVALSDDCNVGLSQGVFRNCIRLHEVKNTDCVTSIGKKCFSGCTKLREADLGKDLKQIGEAAFEGCTSLEALALPHSVTKMGARAFQNCTELESVTLDCATLAPAAFRGCISLHTVELSPMTEAIPAYAFAQCSALSQVKLPMGVKTVGRGAFQGCSRLTNVQFDLGLTKIGAFAFAKTPDLVRIEIPHTLKHLGFGAFGLGRVKSEEKLALAVDSEYMQKRLKRLLFWCGSYWRVSVTFEGKTIEERKRERRRATLEQKPTHLLD